MSALLSIFWGLLLFSVLVFIHEGGHYLAARLFGVRVQEFFIGLPSRHQISHRSRRLGTTFGVTPYLLGGYARIAGMDLGQQHRYLQSSLALILKRGMITLPELAYALNISLEEAFNHACALQNWGSVEFISVSKYEERAEVSKLPTPDKLLRSADERALAAAYYDDPEAPYVILNAARDSQGRTRYDKPNLAEIEAAQPGEPTTFQHGFADFFDKEKSRTYAGLSSFKRIVVLLAGITVNIVMALALFIGLFMLRGVDTPSLQIQEVQQGSLAQELGIEAGDIVLSISGVQFKSWQDFQLALGQHKGGQEFELGILKAQGQEKILKVQLSQDETLGVYPSVQTQKLGFGESIAQAGKLTWGTARAILGLLTPSGFQDTIKQSGSVLAVSVMAKDAAAAGLVPLLSLAAALSLSLGFMNLLPIPPLDGGKVLIELIQAALGKPVSERLQTSITIAGFVLLALLFIYLTGQDIIRLAGF